MRFMMLMISKGYANASEEALPSAKMIAAMTRYNNDLKQAGVLLSLDGLHPSQDGARVYFSGGKPVAKDGLWLEAREILGGFWMIDVDSKEEAVEWAKRCPAQNGDIIEIRQVQELEEFPEELQKAAHLEG